jgi:hypothetical protein
VVSELSREARFHQQFKEELSHCKENLTERGIRCKSLEVEIENLREEMAR